VILCSLDGEMRRRKFIHLLGSTAATWPLAARAQQSDRVRRIGILFGGFSDTDPEPAARVAAFKHQLQELGWIEGRNIQIDLRIGAGDADRVRAFAEELIGMMPDVIVANSTPPVLALARQTTTIPIVFANVFDPTGSGLVTSLARPGANITGFSNFEPVIAGKWLELLKEIAPSVTYVSTMFDRGIASYAEFAQTAEKLAGSFHLHYAAAPVSNAADIQEAMDAIAREPNSGLIVMGGTVSAANREEIIRLAADHRLPAVYSFRYYVTSGGLLSYGVDAGDVFSRTATYVDRILKGAKPADLPVQAPTKFELLINLKTAKAPGLAVSDKLLATADEVIE
jgi:putative tryptophan/tyrosine transport system substrate-binding protein